jgi:hypothetical protein
MPSFDHLRSHIRLIFPPIAGSNHPFANGRVENPGTFVAILPLQVAEAQFERLIDLRIPEVARWFTQHTTRLNFQIGTSGSPIAAFPNKPPIDEFGLLLPSLFEQSLGGHLGVNQIGGLLLRKLGADGLVFPSARSDAYMRANDGVVNAWYGWNLVDYRDTTAPSIDVFGDPFEGWPTEIMASPDPIDPKGPLIIVPNTKIEFLRDGRSKGSWSISGVENWNRAYYWLGNVAFCLRTLLRDGDTRRDDIEMLLYTDLLKHCDPLSQISIALAIQGDPALQAQTMQWILATKSSAYPDYARLLDSLESLLRELQKTRV